jgi:hypothetical protein
VNIETMQKLYEKAFLGLQSQGWEQSLLPGSKAICLYVSGCKRCAVGWLLDTAPINQKLEEDFVGPVSELVKKVNSAKDALQRQIGGECSGDDLDFLERMQRYHDEAESPAEMERNFVFLARFYGLTVPAGYVPQHVDD